MNVIDDDDIVLVIKCRFGNQAINAIRKEAIMIVNKIYLNWVSTFTNVDIDYFNNGSIIA